MARFTFAAGSVSRAVRHRRVEELWYVQGGNAEIWLNPEDGEAEVRGLAIGESIAIPARCAFQVRVAAREPLIIVAVTMPPWPGDAEAEHVAGCWATDDQN